MKRIRNRIEKYLPFVLISIMVLLLLNKVVYTHTHVYNGKVVMHSHPFDRSTENSSGSTHHHSDSQFALYDLGYQLYFLSIILIAFHLILSQRIRFGRKCDLYTYLNSFFSLGRAPPIA